MGTVVSYNHVIISPSLKHILSLIEIQGNEFEGNIMQTQTHAYNLMEDEVKGLQVKVKKKLVKA